MTVDRARGRSDTLIQSTATISQVDLLDKDFAIDGNSAVYSVTADEDRDLMTNLLIAERDIVEWLKGLGYEVEFR